jgi:hypothetical protein
MVTAIHVFHSTCDFFTSSEAAGGAKPQAETPQDAEGSQDARFVLKPGFSSFRET